MWLVKSKQDFDTNRQDRHQDVKHHLDTLAFLHRLHNKQIPRFASADRKDLEFIADFVAGFLSSKPSAVSAEITLRALQYCRDLLFRRAYREVSRFSLSEAIDVRMPKVVIAVGCQTNAILVKRVRAALDAQRSYQSPSKVIFSGLRPSDQQSKIPNESARMSTLFHDQLDEADLEGLLVHPISITKESSSADTQENIARILEDTSIFPAEKFNVFLVTSSFHLPELAQAFESDERSGSLNFAHLVLKPAESYERLEPVVEAPEYRKSMFFTVFTDVLASMQEKCKAEAKEGEVREFSRGRG